MLSAPMWSAVALLPRWFARAALAPRTKKKRTGNGRRHMVYNIRGKREASRSQSSLTTENTKDTEMQRGEKSVLCVFSVLSAPLR
jgi:hypothetical protein